MQWVIRNPTTGNRVIGIGNGSSGAGGEGFTFYSQGAVPALMQTANGHSVSSTEINDLQNQAHVGGYSQAWQTTQWLGPGVIIGQLRAADCVYANTYAAFANN